MKTKKPSRKQAYRKKKANMQTRKNTKIKKWIDKLSCWENGKVQTYPKNIGQPFFFETFPCDKYLQNKYEEKFIPSPRLNFRQDFSAFSKQIGSASNTKAIAFPNLSKDAILVIPMPRPNKDFSSIKGFIDHADLTQQRYFWKLVASSIKRALKTHDQVYVSTHGLGVPYFHLRIDFVPKYFQTKSFIKK